MKKYLLIGLVLLVVLIGVLIGTNGEQPAGVIEVPGGPKIDVIFTGPPELEDDWEKLGMAGFQLQLIGTLTNISDQAVKFSEIAFLLDGQQVAFIPGQTLEPGEQMKIAIGFPGYSESTKVLEVKIKGFQRVGGSEITPTEPTTPESVTEPGTTPEEIALKWYNLMRAENFSAVMEFYTPEAQEKIRSAGGAEALRLAWQKKTIIKMDIEASRTEFQNSQASVYALVDYANGVTGDRIDFDFHQIGGQWKLADEIIGEF